MFCQVFERPTQRTISISPLTVIEAKKSHRAGERLSCSTILMAGELHGCGLAALVYVIKILSWGLFGQVYKNLQQRKFPTIHSFCYDF